MNLPELSLSSPCGIVNLNKPSGPSSHDMVASVRRALGVKQVGHAGALDPLASGVLVLGVGPATRLLTFMGDHSKEYEAEIALGISTDSQDITGAPIRQMDSAAIRREDLEVVSRQFVGAILQIPPMVSALKYQGKRLYELARQGKTVEREARPVTVYDLEILGFEPGTVAHAWLRVRSSGGFYVRTLCSDIGDKLGCGACMSALKRTAVGPFRLEDAVSLQEVLSKGRLCVQSPRVAVSRFPGKIIPGDQLDRVLHGGWFESTSPDLPVALEPSPQSGLTYVTEGESSEIVRLQDAFGQLVGMAHIMECGAGRWRYQPYLVLQLSSASSLIGHAHAGDGL